MRKLEDVEEAKALMNEAMEWSTFKWLFEKQRVRETADRANAVLDRANRSIKTHWSGEAKAAYKHLTAKEGNGHGNGLAPDTARFVENVVAADEAAHRARMKAEDTFDEAERRLSTDLAREGCRQAIHSWKLHEKAIKLAEAAVLSE